MASSLRPQFFCTRPNGTLTPLIAVDELPSHISLCGVPRVLSPNETQGMTSLGTVAARGQFYVVEGVSPASSRASPSHNAPGHRPRDYDLQTTLLRIVSDENIPASQRLALHALLQQNWLMPNPSANGWMVPNGTGSGNGSARQSPHYNTKKEYCSYCIRHGECDYQQQGCLYKHEMPSDPAMLEKLGLRDIPRWYRDKYSIPSLIPNGSGHPRSHTNHGQHWKDDASDRGGMKSIQYPPRFGINGTLDTSDVEKSNKQKAANYLNQQPSAVLPGNGRPTYPAASSPNPPVSQKHGPKHALPNQHNQGPKKIDLLAFDPLPDYVPLDPVGGNMSGLMYPTTKDKAAIENADRVQREEFMRNLQSLMPTSLAGDADYLTTVSDTLPSQTRSKKMQKSRRLYQPRSRTTMTEASMDMAESDSLRNFHNRAATFCSASSAVSKGNPSSHLASPITTSMLGSAMSSSPNRGASPSIHSHTSLSSESSPRALCNRTKERDFKPMPTAIGSFVTRKGHRKRSAGSSEEDLFILAKEHAK